MSAHNVQQVLELMEKLNVTREDLEVYDLVTSFEDDLEDHDVPRAYDAIRGAVEIWNLNPNFPEEHNYYKQREHVEDALNETGALTYPYWNLE